ncbi:MAG: hypothetical protein JO110_09105 [Acetobacteraceae bacterium]|nr:hypothetical protein [Acetobacteraceae bacterium]
MAALLKFIPTHGVLTAAETIARLNTSIEASACRQAGRRPALVCRWLQFTDGRLYCHWEIEARGDISAPATEPVFGMPDRCGPALFAVTPSAGEQG